MTKSDRLSIRISPELKEQLEQAAADERRTVANYIECLILQALAKKERGD